MTSELQLLEGWAAGDGTAAKELFDRYFESLYRFFRGKCGSASDIEDLVQDTLAACVAGRERVLAAASFRAYLFGIARNKLLHHYRRSGPADLGEVAESRLVDLDPTPSLLLARRQEERALLEALRHLSIDAQIVIELYAWENMSGPEVAETLGITEAAMRSRLHRAKQELRRELERIATSDEVLRSTIADLDGWARALRAQT